MEPIKTAICIAFFIASSYFMSLAAIYTDVIYYRYYCVSPGRIPDPLPDVFDSLARKIKTYLTAHGLSSSNVTDPILFSLQLLFITTVTFDKRMRGKRTLIWGRLMIVWAISFIIRAISVTTTVFPSFQDDFCPLIESFIAREGNYFYKGLVILAAPFTQQYCSADYMFSGHAATATVFFLFGVLETDGENGVADKYSPMKFLVFSLLHIASLLSIVLTKLHYTADVVIGFFVALLSYFLYSLISEKAKTKLVKHFPYNIVAWLEHNSPSVCENNSHLE